MTVEEYLASHPIAKIQLGCGGNFLDGWLNTDIELYRNDAVYLDLTKQFPAQDSVFDYVYSEHNIEHLSYWQGAHMLQESYRILKPGGKIRISCPDIRFLLNMYSNPQPIDHEYIQSELPSWAPYPSAIFIINNYVREWGHQFIHDKTSLSFLLTAAGFNSITEHRVRESNDPNLQNLEIVNRMKPGFLQLETMTLEGVKP